MELLGHYDTLTWILVLGSFFSFGVGWATGSNDVANAFGTSVGSKTLTLGQATIIAAVFEFTGAMVLGRVTTSVIAGSITEVTYFQEQPEMYAYGMMWALFVTFLWNTWGSYMELNVSTTHSIIGSILGFALVYGGSKAVNWALKDSSGDSFPPYKGVVPIVCSWFISPILTGLAAAVLFTLIKYIVLKNKNSYVLSFYLLPFFVAFTVWICIYFTLTKGASKYLDEAGRHLSHSKALWIAALTGVGCAFITLVVVLPILRKRADTAMEKRAADEEAQAKGEYVEPVKAIDQMKPWAECNWYEKIIFAATYGTKVDIHDVVEEDPIVAEIHRNAEQFDPKTEYAFSYLQVFSAICVMFAHGANDSAYAAGPLAGIYAVYKHGYLPKKVQPPVWVVFISGISMVIGLATYGYNVTRAMGTRMSKLSASRGFSAELATATIILVASQFGLPTSSSQCITGAIIGVGACEGLKGVNWLFVAKQFTSWIGTLFVCGLGTGALFAQGIYAPSKEAGRSVQIYENWIVNMTRTQMKDFNQTLYGVPMGFTVPDKKSLIDSLKIIDKTTKNYLLAHQYPKYKSIATLQPRYVLPFANNMLSMMHNWTVYAVVPTKADFEDLCFQKTDFSCSSPLMLDKSFLLETPISKNLTGTAAALKMK